MEFYVIVPIISFVGGWLGSFVGAYLRKKGENLATQEDIGKLVEQVAAVTKATKEIEAKISDEVWGRQRVWEMKRDAFFALMKAESRVTDALIDLSSACATAKKNSPITPTGQELTQKAAETWFAASADFQSAGARARIVCGPDLEKRIKSMGTFLASTSRAIATADTADKASLEPYNAKFVEEREALLATVRKELASGH
jgi:hypothetical protein